MRPPQDQTTAAVHGARFDAQAQPWSDLWASLADPAREAVAAATALGPQTRLLDVGCGGGEFCRLALSHGAREIAGIDAADGLIEIARQRLPGADLRVGPIEELPWPDASFDLATAFNSLQFAADLGAALSEAARVVAPGGVVAICNWGLRDECELKPVLESLAPSDGERDPDAPGAPGALEALVAAAGLKPAEAGEVSVPYALPDEATLARALRVEAALVRAAGDGDAAITEAVELSAPFRRSDGSYRFENLFRYVVARVGD